jgi:hypothetical protein
MAKQESKIETTMTDMQKYPPYLPTPTEAAAKNRVLNDMITGRLVVNKSYNYFNNQTLFDCIDDWTMRWNGYTQPLSVLDETSSNIFINYTRSLIISYLSKVALQPIDPKIRAVNRKTGLVNQKFAEVIADLNNYSNLEENAPAKFLSTALEATVKGTAIVYEGYTRTTQEWEIPDKFDSETGKVKKKKIKKVLFDNCCRELCRLEDVYIANPWTPGIQLQPFIVWKKITSYYEAFGLFSKYPNWDSVKPGSYTILSEPTTFYTNQIYTELQKDQVEIVRYYCRKENLHVIMVNGVILYQGPFPFKHGRYPFAKYIFEPFGSDFFWGAGAPFKFMGEQDTQNSFINMMIDKMYGSLAPFGITSDNDDIIEDDVLVPNKIRKVGDIAKWKWQTLPGVDAGEQNMFQLIQNMLKENSGFVGGGPQFTPKGGKMNVRQIMLQEQEAMQKMGYPIGFLEDGERDRTELRIWNIMQFYAVPKIEKITGKNGKEVEDLVYKEARLHDTQLHNGKMGTRVVKLVGNKMDENAKMKLRDELDMEEAKGEATGVSTEALAVPVSMFEDYEVQIQVVRNSSYQRNQTIEQAKRQEYAQWRLSIAQVVPVDAVALVKWVDDAMDIDDDQFTPKGNNAPAPMQPGQMNQMAGNQPGITPPPGQPGQKGPLKQAQQTPNVEKTPYAVG